MAITKETQIGKIEVVGKHKSVQVRTDTVVMEDNEELSRKYHRHALMPDAVLRMNTQRFKQYVTQSGHKKSKMLMRLSKLVKKTIYSIL
jgi:uncharacterized protein YjcR